MIPRNSLHSGVHHQLPAVRKPTYATLGTKWQRFENAPWRSGRKWPNPQLCREARRCFPFHHQCQLCSVARKIEREHLGEGFRERRLTIMLGRTADARYGPQTLVAAGTLDKRQDLLRR